MAIRKRPRRKCFYWHLQSTTLLIQLIWSLACWLQDGDQSDTKHTGKRQNIKVAEIVCHIPKIWYVMALVSDFEILLGTFQLPINLGVFRKCNKSNTVYFLDFIKPSAQHTGGETPMLLERQSYSWKFIYLLLTGALASMSVLSIIWWQWRTIMHSLGYPYHCNIRRQKYLWDPKCIHIQVWHGESQSFRSVLSLSTKLWQHLLCCENRYPEEWC